MPNDSARITHVITEPKQNQHNQNNSRGKTAHAHVVHKINFVHSSKLMKEGNLLGVK